MKVLIDGNEVKCNASVVVIWDEVELISQAPLASPPRYAGSATPRPWFVGQLLLTASKGGIVLDCVDPEDGTLHATMAEQVVDLPEYCVPVPPEWSRG